MHKLGKLAPIEGRKSLTFGDYLMKIPDHPLVSFAPDLVYPMDLNNVRSDCVVAGFDHVRQIISWLLKGVNVNFTDDEIIAFYKTQNPNFPKEDNGMNIQIFLEYLTNNGYIKGFAKIDFKNKENLRSAIYLGLAVLVGVQLQQAQEDTFMSGVWDYDPNSHVIGGHAVTPGGYNNNPDILAMVSWGKLISGTQNFVDHLMDEAWFILTQDHIDHPSFRNHFDLQGFADAVRYITDGKIIIPVTPPIPVPPTPVVRRVLRLISPMMRGDDVKELQNDLTKLGYDVGAIDGIFGKNTKTGVVKFQSDHNLVADGIVGKMTWQAFDMIDIITTVGNANGVESELLIAVASAESSLNPNAKLFNPPSNSWDRGLFEWNNVYHPEITDTMAYDPAEATRLACQAIKAGHLHSYWSASQANWIKHISEAIKTKYGVS